MALFLPLDSKPHLNFSNILKFQSPTQIFQQIFHKSAGEEENSNLSGNSNDISCMMTDEKLRFDVINADESCNSTDSDLSVGQEKIDDDKSENNQTESETVENQMPLDEDEDSSNTSSSRLCNPKQLSENALQMSSILRPNPSRLHEEIFRNSQLYAEELVRQQLAAAARLQSLSGSAKSGFSHVLDPSAFSEKRLILGSTPEDIESKLNFQSGVFAPKTLENNHLQNGNNLFCNNKSAINFQNIHSHLSAISQITNSLTSSSSIKKDDSTSLSSLSRESSQSPNFQHLKQHHHQNMIFHTQQNQLHERNLKFSIDNILKADFGRRITEPLLRTSKSRKSAKQDKELFKKFNAPASMKETFSARDDNPRVSESSPSSNQSPSSTEQSKNENNSSSKTSSGSGTVWPAWVFCTRYSDRPSSGPRVKRPKKPPSDSSHSKSEDEKRPRTAFSGPQLARLKHEFNENRYLTEKRRQQLSAELGLNEAQIKIWFQNKRAKIKKSTGQKNPLALQLMAQGLYNHSTIPLSKEEEEMQELQAAN